MKAHETRHPNWIPVEPGDGVICKGDRYRLEHADGYAVKHARHDYTRHDFDPDAAYFVWPRPQQ